MNFAGVLWADLFSSWILELTNYRVNTSLWTKCRLERFLSYFFMNYSSALLVSMSVEKFFALYFPLRTKTICTVKTAKWVCGISAVVLLLCNLPLIILSYPVDYGLITVCFVQDDFWSIFWHFTASIYSFVPFGVMILMNSAIIFKFIVAKYRSSQNTGTQSTSQALNKAVTRGTVVLLTVSTMFIILTGPMAIGTYLNRVYPLYVQVFVMIVPQYLNHSINGVLYCIVGTKFRNELISLICRRDKKKPSNQTELSTKNTTLSVLPNPSHKA